MTLKIGTILIDENDNRRVVTGIEHGYPTQTEPIEEYISKRCVVEFNGSTHTLKEVMDFAIQEYTEQTDVLHLSSDLTGGS